MIGNRGSEKYYIIISLILGVAVLGLSLYYIFNEYFTEEDLTWESCRQSIILRNMVPDVEVFSTRTFQFKDKFPLKCRAQPLVIDYEDTTRAEKEIAEQFIACWYLLGNGDFSIYPAATWSINSYCSICSRVSFDPSVYGYYIRDYEGEEGKQDNRVSIRRALSRKMDGEDFSYWEYLQNSGQKKALGFFDHWAGEGEGFFVDNQKHKNWDIDPRVSYSVYTFPDKLEVGWKDFYIMVSSVIFDTEKTQNTLFFFQEGPKSSFNQLTTKVAINAAWGATSWKTCDTFETLPG
jgi:hypothetical protein